MPSDQVKLASLEKLRAINERGVKKDFNQLLKDEFFDTRQPDEMFVIQPVVYHDKIAGEEVDDIHLRCLVYPMDKKKHEAFLANLDVTMEDFESLPTPEDLGFRAVRKKQK